MLRNIDISLLVSDFFVTLQPTIIMIKIFFCFETFSLYFGSDWYAYWRRLSYGLSDGASSGD